MRTLIVLLLLSLSVAIFFISCDSVSDITAPEVEVTRFTPLGWYVIPDLDTAHIDSVYFKVWNYVEARLTGMTYRFLAISDNHQVGSTHEWGLDMFIDPGTQDSTVKNILLNVYLNIASAVDYMYANNENTVAEITFSGEDDYGKGKEWHYTIHYSLLLTPTP